MINLSPEICFKFRDARRAAGLRQTALAAEIGCTQSAISMFEKGNGTKLNDEVIRKWAAKFNLELPSTSPAPISRPLTVATRMPGRGFCPNPDCPSNRPYEVEGRRLYHPDRDAADPVGGRFCAVCGELLETRCPHCGAPVHAGAVCSFCGQGYVTVEA